MFLKKNKDISSVPAEAVQSKNKSEKQDGKSGNKKKHRSYLSRYFGKYQVNSQLVGAEAQRRVPFAVVEAYKNIRIRLLSALAENNGKIIAFSSPNASEGKSTTAVNTAITLAQLGKKVIIVDADIRRATVNRKLRLPNEKGYTDVVSGGIALEEAILHYNEFLDVLPSGPVMSNPSESFVSLNFDRLLSDLRETYDYIIIDTPPINLASDALAIGQKCDGMLLVVRASVTSYASLKSALLSVNQLNINLLGTILNGAGAARNKYRSYYRYSKYGYSKYAYNDYRKLG